MTVENTNEETRPRKIKRALLSASDKIGLVEFAEGLRKFGVEILSTGGTAKLLRDAGIEVRDVSSVTGFPEMMDGRVKTLHPRIHGGILAIRDDAEHIAAAAAHDIPLIDLVVIDLYPFEKTISRTGVTIEEAIEQIDIGGPAMIRSAAKNFRDVAVITSPTLYNAVLDEMKANDGVLSLQTRRKLAMRAFAITSRYDAIITGYLMRKFQDEGREAMQSVMSERTSGRGIGAAGVGSGAFMSGGGSGASGDIGAISGGFGGGKMTITSRIAHAAESEGLPKEIKLDLSKKAAMRYGENPHQRAALYLLEPHGVAFAEILNGKEMSYNNYVDADAAWQFVCDFNQAACAIIKHTNPAGVAASLADDESLEAIYRRALKTDPVSAFGGIVAFNRTIDEHAARAVTEIFTEVVIAPDYDESALEILRAKKNLRVLRVRTNENAPEQSEGLDIRTISGGLLVQTRDTKKLTRDELKIVSNRQPTEEEIRALLFAWTVCKHTKSNAIVYARDGQTIGVGAGQMSRVDSVRLGAMRAQQSGLDTRGAVLASDAFFPFRDGIDEAAKHNVAAVIQPGGSVRDEEVIAAANEHDMAMVFTGVRHFRH